MYYLNQLTEDVSASCVFSVCDGVSMYVHVYKVPIMAASFLCKKEECVLLLHTFTAISFALSSFGKHLL